MPNKDEKDRFNGLIPKAPSDDDSLFDRLFFEAAERHLAEQEEYSSREELEKEISFSPEFEARMEAQLKRWEKETRKKSRHHRIASQLMKVASVIIAMLLVFGLTMVTSTAAKNRVFNFFSRITEQSVDIQFSDEPTGANDMVMLIPDSAYQPAYLPEGFVLEAVNPMYGATELIYTKGAQAIQIVTYTEPNSVTLNQENAKRSEFECLGVVAVQLETQQDVIIYFSKDNAFIKLYADIPARELRKVAKNLTK